MAYYAGVDLGATNLRAAVADADGAVLGRHRRRTPRTSRDAIREAVVDAVRAAAADAGVNPTDLTAAGVASVGPLDPEHGAVVDSPNLPGVASVELVDPLQNALGTDDVVLHNDATAGVIAERYYADAPPNTVYLTLSSGIGAGVAVDGRVLSGRNGNAGEVGHVVVDPGGRTCGCGHDGHWEAYCSGENLPGYARDLAGPGTETALPLDDPDFSAVDVFAHADTDEFAAHVVDRVVDWNIVGVTTLVQAYAPEVVSIGGAVALENEALVVDPVRDRLDPVNEVPRVRVTPLGEDVVLRGALASALPRDG